MAEIRIRLGGLCEESLPFVGGELDELLEESFRFGKTVAVHDARSVS